MLLKVGMDGLHLKACLQENARQEDIQERERRTQALVKAEIGRQRRASAVTWGIAKSKAAQNASASRMAQLEADFQAVQAATGDHAHQG